MNFIISANTDIGISKSTNQDSVSVKVINTCQGRMVFAVLCDGMGGLEKGEVASATVIRKVDEWVQTRLPVLCSSVIREDLLREEWEALLRTLNHRIGRYGASQGVRLGTTAVVLLMTQTRYYIMNVGDSRVYEIGESIRQITRDQTFVAKEVEEGRMSEGQAMRDPRRNVLLQCVGASDEVYPDWFAGAVRQNAVYLVCSDGFRHEITPEEIYTRLQPGVLFDENQMSVNTRELIEQVKQRGERDNITAALIRTF